jgi:hypothetical protein
MIRITNQCHDELVDILFHLLPAMDEEELAALFERILTIVRRELARALIRADGILREKSIRVATEIVHQRLKSFWAGLRNPCPQ